jgi:hypothetical protein
MTGKGLSLYKIRLYRQGKEAIFFFSNGQVPTKIIRHKKKQEARCSVSQSCNPSYSRSRDQEVKIKRIAV